MRVGENFSRISPNPDDSPVRNTKWNPLSMVCFFLVKVFRSCNWNLDYLLCVWKLVFPRKFSVQCKLRCWNVERWSLINRIQFPFTRRFIQPSKAHQISERCHKIQTAKISVGHARARRSNHRKKKSNPLPVIIWSNNSHRPPCSTRRRAQDAMISAVYSLLCSILHTLKK